jgi:hypothetical protein
MEKRGRKRGRRRKREEEEGVGTSRGPVLLGLLLRRPSSPPLVLVLM